MTQTIEQSAGVKEASVLARWACVILWLGFLGLVAIVLWGQVFPHTFKERGTIEVGLAWSAFLARTFTFHIGLALIPVLIAALLVRARRLSVLVILVCAFCVSGAVWSLRPKHPAPIEAASVRVATCNLLAKNTRFDDYLDELRSHHIDLVVFQEVTDDWRTRIDAVFGTSHPYTATVKRSGLKSIVIRSRLPISNVSSIVEEHGFNGVLRCEIEIDGRHVAMYGVHLLAPLSRAYLRDGRQQFADLADALEKESLPMIVLGDFNAPTESAQLDRLRSIGLRDAWDIARQGRGGTWPNHAGVFSLFPTRIDHVMLSGQLACTDVAFGVGAGSDHKPVFATVGFATR